MRKYAAQTGISKIEMSINSNNIMILPFGIKTFVYTLYAIHVISFV